MAKIDELLDEVEAPTTAASFNVVSGFKSFVRAVSTSDLFRRLSKDARANDGAAAQVLGRILRLSQLAVDSRYENPNDVAIATYLIVLSLTTADLYAAAVEAVGATRNCWWAAQILEAKRAGVWLADTNAYDGQESESIVTANAASLAVRTSFELIINSEALFGQYDYVIAHSGIDTRPSLTLSTQMTDALPNWTTSSRSTANNRQQAVAA